MVWDRKELREMIEMITIAIPREKDAHRFYLQAAEKARTEGARNLLISMAEQEQGHQHMLKDLLKSLQKELDEMT